MAVNTYLLDFNVDQERFETQELRKDMEDAIYRGLGEFLTDLKRESYIEMDSGFLAVYSGLNGLFATVRGFRQGVVTLNIEYYKPESEEGILSFDNVRSLASVLQNRMEAVHSHRYPAFVRGSGVDKYFLTSDERILEYDIDRVVFEEKSPFQKVQIVHSKTLGNLLILDELQNMSEKDLIYTETLMQRGRVPYEDKEIIILGGGDGCLLWELLKEQPKFVTMLELDEVVMKACAKYLRSACGDCLDSYEGPNHEIIVGDCVETLKSFISQGKKVDYVFGDLTDIPVDTSGESEVWDFVKSIINMSLKLLKPGGIYMTHGNGASVPKSLEHFESLLSTLDVPVTFDKAQAFVPSFLEDWVFYQVMPTYVDPVIHIIEDSD